MGITPPAFPTEGPEAGLAMPAPDVMAEIDAYTDVVLKNMENFEQAYIGACGEVMDTTALLQSSAVMMGDAFGNAFAMMASGAAGAGDAISKSMLAALGQVATMWGRALFLAGLGFSVLPGGWSAAQAIPAGLALQALGGAISGMAGRIGRGGVISGGGGGGFRSSGRGGFRETGMANTQVFIISPGQRALSVPGSMAGRMIDETIGDRAEARRIKEMIETGEVFQTGRG